MVEVLKIKEQANEKFRAGDYFSAKCLYSGSLEMLERCCLHLDKADEVWEGIKNNMALCDLKRQEWGRAVDTTTDSCHCSLCSGVCQFVDVSFGQIACPLRCRVPFSACDLFCRAEFAPLCCLAEPLWGWTMFLPPTWIHGSGHHSCPPSSGRAISTPSPHVTLACFHFRTTTSRGRSRFYLLHNGFHDRFRVVVWGWWFGDGGFKMDNRDVRPSYDPNKATTIATNNYLMLISYQPTPVYQ